LFFEIVKSLFIWEKAERWVSQKPLPLLIILPLVTHSFDFSTAYVSYKIKPELFLQRESNWIIISALYYGDWMQLISSWGILIFLISFFILVLRKTPLKFIPRLFLFYFTIFSLITASTNLSAIILGDSFLGNIILSFLNILAFWIWFSYMFTSHLISRRIKNLRGKALALPNLFIDPVVKF